jgi:hypothetical protein
MCVYGRGKTGKTRFACTFRKPLALIGTEDGTKSIVGISGIDYARLYSSDELDRVSGMLADGEYKTLVLDTAGGFQDIILREVLKLSEVPVQKSWGMADQKQWGVVGMHFKEKMNRIMDLADRTGLDVVVIAHERNFGEEGDPDIVVPRVGAALTPSAATWLNGACDYIGQMFIRSKEEIQTIKVAGKDQQIKRRSGGYEYCLRVGSHDVYMTGFRLPPGRVLPDVIIDPSYEKVKAVIEGKELKGG